MEKMIPIFTVFMGETGLSINMSRIDSKDTGYMLAQALVNAAVDNHHVKAALLAAAMMIVAATDGCKKMVDDVRVGKIEINPKAPKS